MARLQRADGGACIRHHDAAMLDADVAIGRFGDGWT